MPYDSTERMAPAHPLEDQDGAPYPEEVQILLGTMESALTLRGMETSTELFRAMLANALEAVRAATLAGVGPSPGPDQVTAISTVTESGHQMGG